MIPYILLLILLLLLYFFNLVTKWNTFIAVFLVLFLFAFFRDITVGTDFSNYKDGFQSFGQGFFGDRLEPVWYIIYPFFYRFANFRIYVFVYYVALYYFLLRFIWKQSRYAIVTVLLYVLLGNYFESYNIMRQSIAALFVFYSVTYIEKRNLIKFLIIILTGFLFHTSVLLFIPMYFICEKIRNRKKFLIALIIGTLLLGYSGITLLDYLSVGFLDFSKYDMYFNMMRENISFIGLIINTINSAIAIFFVLNATNSTTKYYVSIYVIGVCLNNLLFQYEWLFRLYNPLFLVFIILIAPNIIPDIKSKYLRLSFILFMFLFSFGMFYSLLNNNASGVVPYQLFL
jgi:transmembrane protein EpsG